MLGLPQIDTRELSKADKIKLLEDFYNALESTRKIYHNEIQSLVKEMLTKSINLGNFMVSVCEAFTNSRRAIYEGYQNAIANLERYGEFDWDTCIFKEMNNIEKIMSEVSANISFDDYNALAKVLKEWETKNNYLVNEFKNESLRVA